MSHLPQCTGLEVITSLASASPEGISSGTGSGREAV